MPDNHPPEQLALRFINSTGRHIFLTGRAGTGKTTFLRRMVASTHKKVIVAAPTGIAAINAGGVTLHSLFHLPFGAFLPSEEGLDSRQITTQVTTPRGLIRHIRMHDTKRRMIRELELLVIDEVSMLRADLLDAIDVVLRHIRRNRSVAFGGVQLLFIGDMLQLPPVVKHDEWQFLRVHYPGVFFFQARVLHDQPPVYIELDKIYRQSDPRFIALLNNLRNNAPSHEDIELLNRHVVEGYDHARGDRGIFLTTHNHKADRINGQSIAQLSKPAHSFDAIVTGDFNESQYPLDHCLSLKEGARVMFIKNDHTGERRYFNGKIGTIDALGDDQIVVRFDDGSSPAEVERYLWENKKYTLNKETNEIEEKVAGTFSQYPLRLAWAITVHKSQGLTFDKAVIDVSAAFAPGQVYVALSRLTGLGGLTLTAPLPQHVPGLDAELANYARNRHDQDDLGVQLERESMRFLCDALLVTFDFGSLLDTCKRFIDTFNKEEGRSAKQRYRPWAVDLHAALLPVKEVSDRFRKQLQALPGFSSWDGTDSHRKDELLARMHERVKAASAYFYPLFKDLSNKVFAHILSIEGLSGVKGYVNELQELEADFFSCLQRVQKAEALLRIMLENAEPTKENLTDNKLLRERRQMLQVVAPVAARRRGGKGGGQRGGGRKKQGVGAYRSGVARDDGQGGRWTAAGMAGEQKLRSAEVSLAMHRDGMAIEEIAGKRSLAIMTVAKHLAECVEKGLVGVEHFLDKNKLEQILAASRAVGSKRWQDVMNVLGDEFTFADVMIALAGRGER